MPLIRYQARRVPLPRHAPPRSSLAQAALDARRTRSGAPLWRNAVSGFGSLGDALAAAHGVHAVPAAWQVDPAALKQLIASAKKGVVPTAVLVPKPAASAPPAVKAASAATIAQLKAARVPAQVRFHMTAGGFAGFGLSPEAGAVGSKVGSTVAGAAVTTALTTSSATAGTILASSSVAGPIGLAVGVVIAIAISLFTKHYFNVGDSNAACQQIEALWSKYTGIQGHVAGRALGWQTMNQLMHAAVGAGLFPGNDMHLSFHEGTLQCAGHGDWVDTFTGSTLSGGAGPACAAHNCLPDAYAAWSQQRANVPAGTPDAVYLVDNILLPMNAPGKAQIPWIYRGAQNPQVHQLLYDLADAYIAAHAGGTTPYVEYPAQQVGTATAGAEGMPTSASATGVPPAGSTTAPTSSAAGFPIPSQAGQVNQVGTDPTTGFPIFQVAGQSGLFSEENGQLVPYQPTGSVASNPYVSPPQAIDTGVAGSPGALPALPGTPGTPGSPDTTGMPPAGVTAGITAGGATVNSGSLAMMGGVLLAVYVGYTILEKRKKKHHG